jgi:hypothetical protein
MQKQLMSERASFQLTRHAPLLAVVGALSYAVEGAIALRSPQPDHHWHAAAYAVEIAFVVALLATIPLLPLLPAHASRAARIATRIGQLGFGAMLLAAVASIAAGGNVLGPVFFLGLIGALSGLLVTAISQTRARPKAWWGPLVVLVGLLAGMALGDHGGGILIGISWATVAITLHIGAPSRTGWPSPRVIVVSAALAVLALTAVGANAAAHAGNAVLPTVRVDLNGKSISAPRTVPSGAVRIVSTVTGTGGPDRTVSIVRLQPGATFASAFARVAAHRGNPDYLRGYASIVFDIQANRGETEADVVLAPGDYVALDSTNDNPAKWLRTSFTVIASASAAPLPPTAATVNMIDFAYRGASTLRQGELVRYENTGFVSHMAFGIEVKNQATARKVTAALEAGRDNAAFKLAKTEYAFAGALSPGSIQEQPVATPPGIYVLACFMASQDGSEHTKLGMIKTIDVRPY